MKFEVFTSAEKVPDFVSRAIMWGIGAHFSHIGIIVNETRIFHSTGEGFNEKEVESFLKHNHKFMGRKDITDRIINHQFALGYLIGRIGVEYSQAQYIGFMVPALKSFFRNGRKRGICSEEVLRFMFHCTGMEKVDADYFDPKQAWDII